MCVVCDVYVFRVSEVCVCVYVCDKVDVNVFVYEDNCMCMCVNECVMEFDICVNEREREKCFI